MWKLVGNSLQWRRKTLRADNYWLNSQIQTCAPSHSATLISRTRSSPPHRHRRWASVSIYISSCVCVTLEVMVPVWLYQHQLQCTHYPVRNINNTVSTDFQHWLTDNQWTKIILKQWIADKLHAQGASAAGGNTRTLPVACSTVGIQLSHVWRLSRVFTSVCLRHKLLTQRTLTSLWMNYPDKIKQEGTD